MWKELGYEKSAILLDQLLKVYDLKDFESASAIKQV
jgi:hypothetical protein